MRKDTTFSIRIAKEDLELIKQNAKKARMSQSDYVTRCCLGRQIVVIEGLKELAKELRAIGNNLNQLTVLANMKQITVVYLDMEEVECAMKTGRRMSEYIFTNDDGMPVHPDTFTKYLRRLYDKNGLPKNFHLHTLRHYCVSTMLHCGVDKQTVAELVGHGDTGFLERTYCHPQFKLKQEAAAQMAEAMFKPVDHSSCNENVILVS